MPPFEATRSSSKISRGESIGELVARAEPRGEVADDPPVLRAPRRAARRPGDGG